VSIILFEKDKPGDIILDISNFTNKKRPRIAVLGPCKGFSSNHPNPFGASDCRQCHRIAFIFT